MGSVTDHQRIHVGIVGAGFAGLRCADVLLQHGIDVTIFEARDRLGGRVAQSERIGPLVDLGANWIHGESQNPIIDLAKTLDVHLEPWADQQAVIDMTGQRLTTAAANELVKLFYDGVLEEGFRFSKAEGEGIDARRSVNDYLTEKAQDLFKDEPKEVAEPKRRTFLQIARSFSCYAGSSIDHLSLRYLWMEQTTEGDDFFVVSTYRRILDEVSRRAKIGADIKLNSKVTQIESKTQQNARPRIHIADGSEYEFDEVVVTTPLGWLKKNKQSVFQPGLPLAMCAAIERIGYGTLDKVYVSFADAWWDVPNPADEPEKVRVDDAKGHHPSFTQWLAPAVASRTNPRTWPLEAMNLAALPHGGAHPTLLFYFYGSCAQHVADLATSQPVEDRDAALLKFFRPYLSCLPNYDADNPSCTPKGLLATAWTNDEFAGHGSYSHFPVGLESAEEELSVLRTGCPERHLWFAGEHTAHIEMTATTAGAYMSGEVVAKKIFESRGL